MSSGRFGVELMLLQICLAGLCFCLTGCEDETVERDYPRVRTLEVTNITSEGARFEAEIYEPGDGTISEHGFAWSLGTPNIDYDNRVYLGPSEGTDRFSADISSALTEGATYKVTAFVKSGEYTVYGNNVEFRSLGSMGPVITGFSPGRVLLGDTVTIRGRNFSFVSTSNTVRFNEEKVVLCNPVSDTLLKVIVPYSLSAPQNVISVEVSGNRTNYTAGNLIVDLPVIESFAPASARWGDTVEIFILNLRPAAYLNFYMGEVQLKQVQKFDGRSVKIIVPQTGGPDPMNISIYIAGAKLMAGSQFTVLPPLLGNFSPVTGFWPDTITLYGFFNKNLQQTEVLFGSYPAKVLSVTTDSIKVVVPQSLLEAPVPITYRYGEFEAISAMKFDLPHPRIDNVTPMTEYAGGYVTITGDYFIRDLTTVRFNDEPSKRIYVSRTSILCEAAGNITGEVRLSVSVSGRTTEYGETFVLTNPEVVSFTPQSVSPGDTLTITGENLGYAAYPLIVPIGQGMQVISVSGNTMRAIVPSGDYTSGRVGAYLYRSYTESIISADDVLTILEPEIYSVSPLSGTKGTLVTITGRNFSTGNEFNKITFQGVEVPVLSSTRSEIRFHMPVVPGGKAPFSLSVCGHRVNSSAEFDNLAAWSRLPDLPMTEANCMMDFGDEILVIAPRDYSTRTVYRFNPGTSTFSPAGTVNSVIAHLGKSVVREDKAYLIGSTYDESFLLAFDRNSMSFSTVGNAPEALKTETFILDGDSVLFTGGGVVAYSNQFVRQFWKYNLSSGGWSRLNDLPFECFGANGFSVNGRFFAIDLQRNLWEYNPGTDSWEPRADYPGPSAGYNMNTVCNGKVYCGYGEIGDRNVYSYDPLTNQWSALTDEQPGPRSRPLSFEYDGKVYLGSGHDFGTPLTDFWIYDPSKETGK